jgi:hypothetical protein
MTSTKKEKKKKSLILLLKVKDNSIAFKGILLCRIQTKSQLQLGTFDHYDEQKTSQIVFQGQRLRL